MKKWQVVTIVILIIIIGFCLNSKSLSNQIVSQNNNLNTFYNNNYACNYIEKIYNDENYNYFLPCVKSDNIIIKFINGDECILKDILTNNLLNIDELSKTGLYIQKEEIISEDNQNEEENNNNKEEIVLLKEEEILKYNEEIKKRASMVYDLDSIEMSKEEKLVYINSYKLPTLPKYDGNKEWNKTNTEEILNNRNINNVVDNNIQRGIIVKRANLRSFPTDSHFYDEKNIKNYDRLQESELHVNTPVVIIHTSTDNLWHFVISPFYAGWVKKSEIAYATKEDYEYLTSNPNFGIITEPLLKVGDTYLDMSVKLPLKRTEASEYVFSYPEKNEEGLLIIEELKLAKSQVHIGYVPYTKENILKLASKYLGMNYSWGGMDYGVDCSSFVGNIYRTFGFTFPRNTRSQNKSVGKIIDLSTKSLDEKLNLIKGSEPSLLFQNGHVMLYIGMENNKHYIIHASGSEMKVVKTELNKNTSYLKNINRLVLVGK